MRKWLWPVEPHLWFRRWRRLNWLVRLLPDALAAWFAIRIGGDPRLHLLRWTPKTLTSPLPSSTQEDVLAAAAQLTAWLYPRQARRGNCLPRAYTSYRALRRLGHPAVFVSGLTRTPEGIRGHAWIEDLQGVLAAYREPHNREQLTEQFHYPQRMGKVLLP